MDRTTRKTLAMYGTLQPNSDIDRLYFKQKHRGRGLISIEISVRSEEHNLCLYLHGSNEMLRKGVKKVGIVKTENLRKKKSLRKIVKMSLKINGMKRECIDSLFVKCLKK